MRKLIKTSAKSLPASANRTLVFCSFIITFKENFTSSTAAAEEEEEEEEEEDIVVVLLVLQVEKFQSHENVEFLSLYIKAEKDETGPNINSCNIRILLNDI